MTGRYPREHGIHENGKNALGPHHPTLATIFKEHGYRTAAYIASFVLDARFGLHRGFDVYEDDTASITLGRTLHQGHRPADVVTDNGLAWLKQESDKPFFCWLHYFDPHTPYQPPAPFGARFAHPYDGEIAFMDSQIKRVMDWLRGAKLEDQTLVVVVGDHGEALGEHGIHGHALFIYEDVVHVPMLFVHPKFVRVGQIPAVVEVADVFPTLVELFGHEAPDDLMTRSLAAALIGQPFDDDVAYSENEYGFTTHRWAQQRSLTTSRWKYVSSTKHELYDRQADPGELRNLVRTRPDVARDLRQKLERFYDALPVGTASVVAMDPDALKQLETLGYVQSQGGAIDEFLTKGAPDPKEMLPVMARMGRAAMLMAGKDFADALPILRALVSEVPGSAQVVANLGVCLLHTGEMEQAREKLDEALAMDPESTEAHEGLGDLHAMAERFAEALDHYRMAIATGSDKPAIVLKIGEALLRLKRADEAVEHFGSILSAHGEFPAVEDRLQKLVEHLSVAQLRSGQVADCVRTLRTGATHAPDPRGVRLLATLLATLQDDSLRDGKEALHWANRLMELREGNAQPLDLATLAAAYAETGDYTKAIQYAERAIEACQDAGESRFELEIRNQLTTYRAGRPYRHSQF